jgi:hypothetical protein
MQECIYIYKPLARVLYAPPAFLRLGKFISNMNHKPIGCNPWSIFSTCPSKGHCYQIAENSAKKLKYSGRKNYLRQGIWSGTLAEIAEK